MSLFHTKRMKEKINLFIPIGTEHSLYWAGFLFPTISVFTCWGFYYFLGHHHKNHLPTISQTVLLHPEDKIFAATMTITSLILATVFYIRQKLVSVFAERRKLSKDKLFNALHLVSNVLAVLICLSLPLVAYVTLNVERTLHIALSIVFFGSITIYYIVSDINSYRAGFDIHLYSLFLPYVAIVIITGYFLVFHKFLNIHQNNSKNIALICQYTGAFIIFFKILLMGYDQPPFTLACGTSHIKFM